MILYEIKEFFSAINSKLNVYIYSEQNSRPSNWHFQALKMCGIGIVLHFAPQIKFI